MKILGTKQFHQKTFKLLALSGSKFKGLLGDVPRFFIAVIYGFSGNGKTEACIQLARELSLHGKVLWLSYEQRHGYDLQKATMRNKMDDRSGNFLIADPLDKKEKEVSLLEDLDNYLKKRNSADYVFFDSLDYTGLTWDDYCFLKNKYGKKKGLIFIAHSTKTGVLKKRISEQIVFDGGMGFFVKDFIMFPEKNRYSGFEPYVIYEKQARLRNPLFFEKQMKEPVKKQPNQTELFTKPKLEEIEVTATELTQTNGVLEEKQV